jgi:guanylate kinase
MLFVVSGPSGSGKTTLCNKLLSKEPSLKRSVSVTTRAPRKGEVDGKDYFFISREKFLRMLNCGKFLEWASVEGNFYATPLEFVQAALSKGKSLLLCIDVQGAMQVRKIYPWATFIFILPPSWKALRERLKARSSETPGEIARRLRLARKELSYLDRYEFVVINDQIDRALAKLRAIVIAQNCKKDNVLRTHRGIIKEDR